MVIYDKQVACEFLKMVVRRETISYSIARKKSLTKEKANLLSQLQQLEKQLSEKPCDEVNEEYFALK